jgi:cytochrome c553
MTKLSKSSIVRWGCQADSLHRGISQEVGPKFFAILLTFLLVNSLIITLGLRQAWAATPAAVPVNSSGGQFFETKIRPLLADQCYACHGPKEQKGSLRLDNQTGLMKGGESGAIVVPGHPDQSLLIKAILYKDSDLQMPPSKKLSERQAADLTAWVKAGAPWPESSEKSKLADNASEKIADGAAGSGAAGMVVTDADRAWWAFKPISRPTPPRVRHGDRVANSIDAFVLAKLEEKGLEPNPLADKRTLIRRAYFDLIGLPPRPEEVEAFIADTNPKAYEELLDRLLDRPEYGERWARFWLDIVRYGQTNGYERDGEKPEAWRYRDYVIRAFNEDKPYDQFVREQLAGDELDQVSDDSIIATGYYYLGVHDDEPDDQRMNEYDELDDIVRTTSTAFLGLTVGCARCHDHKFDPIPQADYYRLLGFFHNINLLQKDRNGGTYRPINGSVEGNRAKVEKALADSKRRIDELTQQLRELKQKYAKSSGKADQPEKNKQEIQRLVDEIRSLKKAAPSGQVALSVRESGPTPRKTNVLIRGNAATPAAEVEPAFLTVLGGGKPSQLKSSDPQSTGLRRALAQWLTSRDHPLTARVMVNRIWQYHFGKGIVPTVDDFGKTGLPPSHPELLDYLAGYFIDSGWSIKKMQKLVMLSGTYRMSSRSDKEATSNSTGSAAVRIDPGNDLLWRQNMRRLDAEAIRDSLLAVSGDLNPARGGRGFFPRPSRELIAGGSRPGNGWSVSTPVECNRRSIYAYEKRSMLPSLLDTFDFNNTAMPSGERSVTTVAPQALMLLNDDFLQQQSAEFAKRVLNESKLGQSQQPEHSEQIFKQIDRAYNLALGREPTDRERKLAAAYIDRQTERFKGLQEQFTLRPEVPGSLADDYLHQLSPEDFLSGPRTGWTYGRGQWGGGYSGILTLTNPASNSPFALDNNVRFADGIVEGRVRLADGVESAAIILRGREAGRETHSGYDIVFDPKTKTLKLERHGRDANDVTSLADAPLAISPGSWIKFRIEVAGPRTKAWAVTEIAEIDTQSKPLLDATDPKPLAEAGSVGARAWGAAVTFDSVHARFDGKEARLVDAADSQRSARQAMQSFCLILFNLNEFVYID